MMEKKKNLGFGSRGWILTLSGFLAFIAWVAFGNYPQNVLTPMYVKMHGWNPTLTSTAYSIATVLVVIFQLMIGRRIAHSRVKRSTVVFGSITMVLAFILTFITNQPLFMLVLILFRIFGDTWVLVCNGILAGQWFPTRKGTVMGVATIALPLAGGFGLAIFGVLVQKGVFTGFLPFFIIGVLAVALTGGFLSDYPEQVGAFRDNDRSMTAAQAQVIMEEEIKAKHNSCWHGKNLFACSEFWFLVIPTGLLLFGSVGVMVQIVSVLTSISKDFFASYGPPILAGISVFACIGSWLIGIIDTRFGTKSAIVIAGICMLLAGIAGIIGTVPFILVASFFLAVFLGAASNFTVSAAAEYWGRSDFPSVYAYFSPVANIIGAPGPALIAIVAAMYGFSMSFAMVAILAVITIILPLFVKHENIEAKGEILKQKMK